MNKLSQDLINIIYQYNPNGYINKQFLEVRKLKFKPLILITDDLLKKIDNKVISKLCLYNSQNITNEGIKNLVNVKKLKLLKTRNITDNRIKNLINCKVIYLN